MNIHTECGAPYLTFKSIDKLDAFRLVVSTRHGGVSKDECSSMNLGTSTDDKWENVVQNYRIFCKATGFDIERLVLAKQTHSSNVRLVKEEDAGKGVLRQRDYTDVDALITNIANLPLVIHTADCVPVAFLDTKTKAIGNAHCGWRGTYGLLAEKTLLEMNMHFGTEPKDLAVAIGPCICMDCYEVSKELYEQFLSKFGYRDYIIENKGKYYLNLPMINRQILIDAGVKEENITVSDVCTCCNCDDMFSHRGLGPKRGILGTFLKICE